MNQKFVFAGLFFVCILLSGYWLSRTGKPLNIVILTIHKLISLGAIVFLVITVYRVHRLTPLNSVTMMVSAVALLFFLGLVATGGLLSASRPMAGAVLKTHQFLPYLVVIATSVDLYLLGG